MDRVVPKWTGTEVDHPLVPNASGTEREGADSGLQPGYSHKPSDMLPLLSVRPALTFPDAEQQRRPFAATK